MSQNQFTYAYCPNRHLHRLLIHVPKNIPVFCGVTWPPECLDYPIVSQNTTYVSQLRPIRVANCPQPIDEAIVSLNGFKKSSPMIPVKIRDIVFFAHIASESAADYMNENLYNLIKSTETYGFVFRETYKNLRKYVDCFRKPIDVLCSAVLPFEITTSAQTRILYHAVNVVKGERAVQCVLGRPFLSKLGVSMLSISDGAMQIGKQEWNEFVYFWEHKYNGHKRSINSIYDAP